jgi:uncharacterized protein (DUF952 family)
MPLPLLLDSNILSKMYRSQLWADSRMRGRSRDSEASLDVDVILAAQANQMEAQIVTTNEKHFHGIADVFDWRSFMGSPDQR